MLAFHVAGLNPALPGPNPAANPSLPSTPFLRKVGVREEESRGRGRGHLWRGFAADSGSDGAELNPADVDNSASPILALARTIEAKDPYTAGHTWRVANYGRLLAVALNYPVRQVAEMSIAGSLHDIGKIAVPDEILVKPTPLTDAERTVMQRHPRDGYDFLRFDHDFMGALDVVLMHHEAYDGSGYPIGLEGESIPPAARLFAVVDAFDAMTSSRPYRPGMPPEDAIAELIAQRGRQFDGVIVDVFLTLFRRGELAHIIGHSDDGVRVGRCLQCGPVIEVRVNHRAGDHVVCRVCANVYRVIAIEGRDAKLEHVEACALRIPDVPARREE
ncbi:MAG TPA: HD-GYP domain-containing protein [Phycisphaerae bacterium]